MSYEHNMRRRILQEIWASATKDYWLRRAEQLEIARPRAGDFRGRATAAELADVDGRLAAAAEACRHRATLAEVSLAELDEALESLGRGAAA